MGKNSVYNADVAIIGGGVNGNAVAYYCAKAGMDVLVIERQDILNGASSACDTAIHLQSKKPGVHLDMAMKSIKKYPALQREFDVNFHFKITGTMLAIQHEKHMAVMDQHVSAQRAAGLNVRLLDEKETLEIQPAMKGGQFIGSSYCDQDATIHSQNLTLAYYTAAKKLGVKYLLYTSIQSFDIQNGVIRGVETDQGRVNCKNLVNACGPWAPLVGEMMGVAIPIAPRRGQIIVSEPIPKLTNTIINCAKYIAAKYNPEILEPGLETELGIGLSLTQSERGNMLLGGTREFVGYQTGTTLPALKLVAKHGGAIVPALRDLSVIRTFGGLRPYTPDGLPILGKVPGIQGAFIAAGHEGDGLALSAITGEILSEMIGEKPISSGVDVEQLRLERFGKVDLAEFRQKYNIKV